MSERAAFLEKKVERSPSLITKGIERKADENDDETLVLFKKVQVMESRPQERLRAESSPSKVPDGPREERWLRKNPASASLPSAPERGQPSWMELAKRKSMAWSDKSMD